ncbi:putative taxadien-5-alpha-ol O-acetyltransferase [Oryza sativa Japonica Group]|jgi:hypothetical protein|uniref:Acyl transferase 9 n=3 Tax=Oryza TaxID=4527 RepID=AT9_ORYSJ|nr:acyl transferase 9 [Oryza sativa Japonica Group]XP_052160483.1 acyl transferase 9 [Oryza glaberrima]Q9LGQ6.1 RecName: Full=Acyl transferase 9; Short=OsAT9 [Oryza sativa Japonica Group]EEC70074.1 hypothetical protein OsI_00687 [Oryza sativa Indica Group]KAB8080272.1 hypothetical protein EE612_000694 [Oryza sativa]KAF2948811.1 hypothetical protein DAI22_01g062000 [Oryza sativa Japonica Group]BAB03362.1 putative taxadien-5-alpha-ol O-acetyltransferase [Oryza sativa Japonica Group]BAF04153.1 |eukprot:NP_001042239.1 Os01g0185300 [Oryza sativa Japonica Group]
MAGTGSFKVTRISEGAVKPAAATPEETLPLAWVDRYPTHRGLVESMHIFRSGADAAPGVIRDALARALVFFYPLAGRIVEPEAGSPAIRCTADGVYFAEAAADCSLEDVRFLERPLLLPKEDLVPYPGDDRWGVEPHNTIMMMQITKFTCGGFVMGLRFNHASADGMGAAQFINAVGDMARGLPEPRVKPVWDREKFPNPSIKPGPLPGLPVLALDYIVLDFPTGYIDGLKAQYKAHSGKFCSGFDVLTAKLWQCRTRALNLEPGATVKLCFFASVRHLLKLDRGYYGNSIFPVKMSAPSETVLSSSVMEVVDMIRQAKERMAVEFFQFAKEETEQDPFQMTFNYESIYVSDWSKLGFAEVDYGFGPPKFAGPLVNNDFIASVVILKAPLPLDGTRMLASCVTKEHSEEFVRGMKEDLP